jgi:hypothetical protein
MAAHLAQAARKRPDLLKDLEGPEYPWAMGETWENFLELHRTRSRDMGEMEAISYQEIQAWSRLTQSPLTPFQVRAIAALDAEALKTHHQKRAKKQTEKKPDGVNSRANLRHQHKGHPGS